MKFRTEIEVSPFSEKIGYSDSIFTIGSCFSERIGAMMQGAKLPTTINPTGTLFNPASIAMTLERLATGREVMANELAPYDAEDMEGGWFHYEFHSQLSAATKQESCDRINQAIREGHDALSAASWVVITLGTAWVYELAQEGESEGDGESMIVANCHKQPSRNFNRRRLSVAEVSELLSRAIERYLPSKNIILTVSPVRHIGDGLSENALSKATLRLAIEQISHQLPHRTIEYFPAYEVLMDDLRDYRYYCDDMVHPSQMAVEYIWQLFCDAALTPQAIVTMGSVQKIMRTMNHRVANPHSEGYRKLCESQLHAINALHGVDMEEEKLHYEEKLRIFL